MILSAYLLKSVTTTYLRERTVGRCLSICPPAKGLHSHRLWSAIHLPGDSDTGLTDRLFACPSCRLPTCLSTKDCQRICVRLSARPANLPKTVNCSCANLTGACLPVRLSVYLRTCCLSTWPDLTGRLPTKDCVTDLYQRLKTVRCICVWPSIRPSVRLSVCEPVPPTYSPAACPSVWPATHLRKPLVTPVLHICDCLPTDLRTVFCPSVRLSAC